MPIRPADLHDLLTVSRFAGGDVLLAQGGGGNTSVKSTDGQSMWIKASGFRLAEMTETAGFLAVDLPALRTINTDPGLAATDVRLAHDDSIARVRAAATDAGTLRPSLEAGFHAALPHRVVLHTHSVMMNAFTCMGGGREQLAAAGGKWPWVEYGTPGYALSALVGRAANAHPAANGFVLANHGVITGGATPAEAIAEHDRMTKLARKCFGELPANVADSVQPLGEVEEWATHLQSVVGPERIVRAAARVGLVPPWPVPPRVAALVPDDVVYGLHGVRYADASTDPDAWLTDQIGGLPNQTIVWLAGSGFVLIGPSARNVAIMEENLLANVLIHRIIAPHGVPNPLPADEVEYIAGMESEHYRQAVASGRSND